MKMISIAAGAVLALAAARPWPGKSVKIGFVSTFSGPTAVIGNDPQLFELALDHIGRKMGAFRSR